MPLTEQDSYTIEAEPWRSIRDHAQRDYPREACGVLLGHVEKPRNIVAIRPTRNAAPDLLSTRYVVDPQELLEVQIWAEDQDLEICGFYHSHPDHPAVPSEHDRHSAWEGYLYLILSVKEGRLTESRVWSWHPERKEFKELTPNTKGSDNE